MAPTALCWRTRNRYPSGPARGGWGSLIYDRSAPWGIGRGSKSTVANFLIGVDGIIAAYHNCKDDPTRTRYQAVKLYGIGYPTNK